MAPNFGRGGAVTVQQNYSTAASSPYGSSLSGSDNGDEIMDDTVIIRSDSGADSDQANKHGHNEAKESKVSKHFVGQETKAVNLSKLLVILVLFGAALTVGTLTYTFVSKSEDDTFKNEFKSSAQELIRQSITTAKNKFGLTGTLAHQFTSYAENRNVWWPFVTVYHFEVRTLDVRNLSSAELIVLAPIVTEGNLSAWEEYSVGENQSWIEKGLHFLGVDDVDPGPIPPEVHPKGPDSGFSDWHLPVWQMGPAPTNASIVNMDLRTNPSIERLAEKVKQARVPLLSEVVDMSFMLSMIEVNDVNKYQHAKHTPYSFILQPVDAFFPEESRNPSVRAPIVAFVVATVSWDAFFQNALPEGRDGFEVFVSDNCGGNFMYRIDGPQGRFRGYGDLHERKYDSLRVRSDFTPQVEPQGAQTIENRECSFTIDVYPTTELHETYKTNRPVVYTLIILFVFAMTVMIFVLYDFFVHLRQTKVQKVAEQSQAIVSSLFPKSFQSRMLEVVAETSDQNTGKTGKRGNKRTDMERATDDGDSDETETAQGKEGSVFKSRPIADLFPNTTVLFADIVGFTAWSSMREPAQVFTLLETIYQAYDEIAKKRRVFKVETVGDCYVACAGLPDPRKDHAVVMARFAHDCLIRVKGLLNQLEVFLGPDTAELGMRFGLNSGQVTAGILRGDRARFQLFGDTVNTAARIETTGLKNRIHLSQETADLLIAAGKEHWVCPREDLVLAKGKGELQTYWLVMRSDSDPSTPSNGDASESPSIDGEAPIPIPTYLTRQVKCTFGSPTTTVTTIGEKHQRLVDWNVALMMRLLKAVKARRDACGKEPMPDGRLRQLEQSHGTEGKTVLDEVAEVVNLPQYDAKATSSVKSPETVALDDAVELELRKFVETIALMYHDNPFHNFEHASHVTMSTVKLLSRIVAPALHKVKEEDVGKELHDHTYGLASDPLTQFSVVLAALVHDLDHPGVPNAQLVKEAVPAAALYKNKSVAEQNSIDIAWDLLMSHPFWNLRRAIYRTESAFKRFRQLLVNTVMATDIMDKDLGALRKNRWNKAFSEHPEDGSLDSVNRKATIVIEHLIQASDVAHTMQHWHIYTKWNERLFREMYKAYKAGRAEKNPADNWYEGEIGFFDFYIIPLAVKLRSCGVFGVSSDEYLNYAQQNRREWEVKGREFVAQMVENCRAEFD